MYKTAFLDTGFLIRLLDSTHEDHNKAVEYFKYLQRSRYIMRVSTIAIAEYCVRGEYEDIPTSGILPSPFNASHAVKSGIFGKHIHEERNKWIKSIGGRDIMKNDVKLMAHAEADNAVCYITFDSDSKKLHDILRRKKLIRFDFWNANNPVSSYTGEIPFE